MANGQPTSSQIIAPLAVEIVGLRGIMGSIDSMVDPG